MLFAFLLLTKNKKYAYFNTRDFQIKKYTSINDKFNTTVIDLGSLNDDFISNIEKFIELSPKINKLSDIQKNRIINKDKKFLITIPSNISGMSFSYR